MTIPWWAVVAASFGLGVWIGARGLLFLKTKGERALLVKLTPEERDFYRKIAEKL